MQHRREKLILRARQIALLHRRQPQPIAQHLAQPPLLRALWLFEAEARELVHNRMHDGVDVQQARLLRQAVAQLGGEIEGAELRLLMVVAGVPLSRRDPDRDAGGRQQPFALDVHLQYVTRHEDHLSPFVGVRQIFGFRVGLFIAHKIAKPQRILGRLVFNL